MTETPVGDRRILPVDGQQPDIDATAWVAPGATLIGRVSLHPRASVWYGAVLRGDGDAITVGERSNIQDGCVMHADPGKPATVGAGVTVGHRAVLHGCTVEDDVLIGMGAVVMNEARIGSGSLVAAGTVVLEGTDIPPGSLVAGVPGKVRRELSDEERESIRSSSQTYLELSARHASSAQG